METIPAKTLLYRTKDSSWFGTDYTMNLYKGCCHNCIYCDSRSDCYHIEHFENVRAKENALVLLRDALKRKVQTGVIGMGAMSDPYNPFEKEALLTRHALELIEAYGFGAAIATKGTLITRDIDLLQSIQTAAPVIVKITITTPHDSLSKQIEPHAPLSSQRLDALRELSKAGIFAGVLLMPVLPYITDRKEDIIELVKRIHDTGARFIYPSFGVTLRQNQRVYYYDALDRLFPGLSKTYQKRYGNRYICSSPHAKSLYHTFAESCEKYGLFYEMKSIIHHYKAGYHSTQLSLFD